MQTQTERNPVVGAVVDFKQNKETETSYNNVLKTKSIITVRKQCKKSEALPLKETRTSLEKNWERCQETLRKTKVNRA